MSLRIWNRIEHDWEDHPLLSWLTPEITRARARGRAGLAVDDDDDDDYMMMEMRR